MTVDNPEKYNTVGGLHLERMTKEDAEAEGLDQNQAWIVLGIKENEDVKVAIFTAEHALKIADAIRHLATVTL